MSLGKRKLRRICGVLASRLPDAQLDKVADPRSPRGVRWKNIAVLLRAVVVSIAAGYQSCKETEHLTDCLSRPIRRQLGIWRRIPDTTLRTNLCAIDPSELRNSLTEQIRSAYRRKQLAPKDLPFGVVAIDGKGTSISTWDNHYAQRRSYSHCDGYYGLVRTFTASLISSAARPCIDACPIPAHTNEMGHFKNALAELMAKYGSLEIFSCVSTDAGMCSLDNANAVVDTHGLHYLFRLKADQPTLFTEAKRILGRLKIEDAIAKTEDVVGADLVVRYLFLTDEMAQFMGWHHLKTTLRIRKEFRDRASDEIKSSEDHYAISSLSINDLQPAQWLLLFRLHWAVENNCHNTWDKIFREDERPWFISGTSIDNDKNNRNICQAVVNVFILRRMAYNMLTLYRSVTLRSEENRLTPWKILIDYFRFALVCASDDDVLNLRRRAILVDAVA